MPDVMKTVGRYEILRELGRGGMALVYLARQSDLDRFVALKELGAFHASDPSFAQRFVRESRVAGSLSHPNVVTVHDYFEHEGTPYIAMEYVERGSLRPFVGKMTMAQIAGVLEGLLAGLTHGEQNGIVHRDLKPENLMVTSDGRVKIADFGIAKATTKMQTGAFLTATGTTVGTPTYMAPEQAMAQDIGPWTDLYSVGCMAFEMFTGRVPFHDSDAPMAILLRHVNEPIAPVKSIDPNVDERISDWVERMLVKDPKQRTQSAAEAWDDFEEIIIGLLGPRWRREARLAGKAETVDTPGPLTPAPFEGTSVTDGTSDDFQSFAWGTPGTDPGTPAATPGPYTPPPQDLPPGPITPPPAEAAPPPPGPATPPPVPAAAAPAPPAPVTPPPSPAVEEPREETGFLTFGAPAPPPPTDALVPSAPVTPPPSEAVPAEPPAAATPPPSEAVAPPAAATPPPMEAPAPPAEEPVEEEPEGSGFETYIAPPPSRPPTVDPGTEALGVPVAEPAPAPEPEPVPEPVAAPPPPPPPPAPEPEPEPATVPTPEPVATVPTPEPVATVPTPEPVAAAPTPEPVAATVMPEALRRPEPAAAPAPAADRGEREPGPSKAFPIAIAAGVLLAVIIGYVVGGSGGGGDAGGGAATVATAGGDVALKVPQGWSRVGSPPDVPGLSLAKPVAYAPGGADGKEAVLFGVVEEAADNSTLLALPLLQALGEVPKASGAVQIGSGDLQALRYDGLKASGFDRPLTIYAAPTTAGVATLACIAPASREQCDGIAATLGLTSGDPYPIGPSKAYADAVGKALGDLDGAVKSGQAKLKAAKTPAAQGQAARSISGAYDKAGKALGGLELSPADRGANTRLVTALEDLSSTWSRAAAAAGKKDKGAFSTAGKAIASAEKELAGALDGLKNAGYGVAS